MKSIAITSIAERARDRSLTIDKIDLQLPMEQLQFGLEQIHQNFIWTEKDGAKNYRSIGLQFTDWTRPYSDAVDALSMHIVRGGSSQYQVFRPMNCFPYFNSAAEPFRIVFESLGKIRSFRARLLAADPGFILPDLHTDGRFGVRLHIPITTNPDAWLEVDGNRFHLPADGSAYLINTARPHRLGNEGTETRVHLVLVLYEASFWNFNDLFFERLTFFSDQIGLDFDLIPILQRGLFERTQGQACSVCGNQTRSFTWKTSPTTVALVLGQPHQFLTWFCADCARTLTHEVSPELGSAMQHDLVEERQAKLGQILKSHLRFSPIPSEHA